MEPIFETALVTNGRVRLLDRHLARLARCGADPTQVAAVADAFRHASAVDQVLRVDVSDAGVVATARAPRAPTAVDLARVIAFDPSDATREAKRAGRGWAAAAEATAGSAEALLVSKDGLVGETTRANVFCLLAGEVVTPPAAGILSGITRSWVIETTAAVERPVTIAELQSADAVFLTTAGRGIVAVVGRHAPLVDDLARRWRAL